MQKEYSEVFEEKSSCGVTKFYLIGLSFQHNDKKCVESTIVKLVISRS